MQILTSPGVLPRVVTYGASRFEWLTTETSNGDVLLTHPDGEFEQCSNMDDAVSAVILSIESKAEDLREDGEVHMAGELFAEAQDIAADRESLVS